MAFHNTHLVLTCLNDVWLAHHAISHMTCIITSLAIMRCMIYDCIFTACDAPINILQGISQVVTLPQEYPDKNTFLGPVSQKVKINCKFDYYGNLPLNSIVRSILTVWETGPWISFWPKCLLLMPPLLLNGKELELYIPT